MAVSHLFVAYKFIQIAPQSAGTKIYQKYIQIYPNRSLEARWAPTSSLRPYRPPLGPRGLLWANTLSTD